jgi:hypothetical protein
MKANIKDNIIKDFGEPASLDELAYTIIKIINQYQTQVIGFSWKIRHEENVSNSHYCPIDGVTNWGGTENIPKSYKGWQGRVWIRYATELSDFASKPFCNTLTYPGTGGFGSYNGPWENISSAAYLLKKTGPIIFSWDYRFFDNDWPLIKQYVEELSVYERLSNIKQNYYHTFLWEDENTAKLDADFLSDSKTIKALNKRRF